jgi:hypothetical protein
MPHDASDSQPPASGRAGKRASLSFSVLVKSVTSRSHTALVSHASSIHLYYAYTDQLATCYAAKTCRKAKPVAADGVLEDVDRRQACLIIVTQLFDRRLVLVSLPRGARASLIMRVTGPQIAGTGAVYFTRQ